MADKARIVSSTQLQTLPPAQTVEPFGKVTYRFEPDGRLAVRAYILTERTIEGARAGIAVDGSGTMMRWFGAQRKGAPNIVSPFVQRMCVYLAQHVATDGQVTAIYWATGDDGRALEEIGTLSTDQSAHFDFVGPRHYGAFTCLLPALKYYVEKFATSPWGLYVFVTDGRLDDLEDVKAYTIQLAHSIAQEKRPGLKLVMIGVGGHIDEAQMQVLDDLDTGTNVDLWDHKLANTMQHLAEVFTEVVDENMIIAEQGRVLDDQHNVLKDYRDTGLPAVLEFVLLKGAKAFTVEIGVNAVIQKIV